VNYLLSQADIVPSVPSRPSTRGTVKLPITDPNGAPMTPRTQSSLPEPSAAFVAGAEGRFDLVRARVRPRCAECAMRGRA
jgi:hypothetical protein